MARHFLISLTDVNLDRSTFRDWDELQRALDWRLQHANYLQRVRDLLPRLPPVERDVVELYYCYGKKQETIARMLDLSQQAVSHRLHSAYRRITFLLDQPEIEPDQMFADLSLLIPSPFTVRVLCDFAATSSQTVTARRLNVPQQRICWHLTNGLKALRDSDVLDAVFYVKYFEDLRRHRNILREVAATRRKRSADAQPAPRFARYARGSAASYAYSGASRLGVAGGHA